MTNMQSLEQRVGEFLLHRSRSNGDLGHQVQVAGEGISVFFCWDNEECDSCRNPGKAKRAKDALMGKVRASGVCGGCRALAEKQYLIRQRLIAEMVTALDVRAPAAHMNGVPAFPPYPDRYWCPVSANP